MAILDGDDDALMEWGFPKVFRLSDPSLDMSGVTLESESSHSIPGSSHGPTVKNVRPMRETEMGVSESLETGYWKDMYSDFRHTHLLNPSNSRALGSNSSKGFKVLICLGMVGCFVCH